MWNSISRLINPDFKPLQNNQKRNFKGKKGQTLHLIKRENLKTRKNSLRKTR